MILLAIAAFASVLAVRQVLLVRLDDRVEEDLQQEVRGVPRAGRDWHRPANAASRSATTSRRSSGPTCERNVPDDDEELITVPRRGTPRRDGGDNTESFTFGDFIERWRTLEEVERGDIDTPGGPGALRRDPGRRARRATLGTFVVAIFIADEREEVDEAVQIVAVVAGRRAAARLGASPSRSSAGCSRR